MLELYNGGLSQFIFPETGNLLGNALLQGEGLEAGAAVVAGVAGFQPNGAQTRGIAGLSQPNEPAAASIGSLFSANKPS
jgi:hypothetical protein